MLEPIGHERRIVMSGFLFLLAMALLISALQGRDVTPIATAMLGFLGGHYLKR